MSLLGLVRNAEAALSQAQVLCASPTDEKIIRALELTPQELASDYFCTVWVIGHCIGKGRNILKFKICLNIFRIVKARQFLWLFNLRIIGERLCIKRKQDKKHYKTRQKR